MADLNEIQKMLRAIINGQSAFRQEVNEKFEKVDLKFAQLEERLGSKIDGVEKRLTERIDKLGRSLAFLEDDTPTREEFSKES